MARQRRTRQYAVIDGVHPAAVIRCRVAGKRAVAHGRAAGAVVRVRAAVEKRPVGVAPFDRETIEDGRGVGAAAGLTTW